MEKEVKEGQERGNWSQTGEFGSALLEMRLTPGILARYMPIWQPADRLQRMKYGGYSSRVVQTQTWPQQSVSKARLTNPILSRQRPGVAEEACCYSVAIGLVNRKRNRKRPPRRRITVETPVRQLSHYPPYSPTCCLLSLRTVVSVKISK